MAGREGKNSEVEPLACQLERIRAAAFVGREQELALFDELISPETAPHALLVTGHGGTGKSTLLHAFQRRASERGVETRYVDARDLPQDRSDLASALDQQRPPSATPGVLMIDTFEAIESVERWLRDEYLPRLPGTTRVVIAGRWAPATTWSTDPAWALLTRHCSLRDFGRPEVDSYLAENGIDTSLGEHVHRVTRGHPLAVGMLTSLLREDPQRPIQLEANPEIVDALVAQYLDATEDDTARRALYASSIARALSEPMLAELLELPDTHGLFEWLSQLSFMHRGRRGLQPHDLVGESLRAALKWRAPQLHQELVRRTTRYLADRFAVDDSEAAIQDFLFALRELPGIRETFVIAQDTGLNLSQADTADGPALAEIVARHEGAESRWWLEFWWQRRPEGFRVLKDISGTIAGFALYLDVTDLTGPERADPAVARYLQHLRELGPLPPGRWASLCRFVMASESYQSPSPAMTQLLCSNALRGFRDTRLAHQGTVREDTAAIRYQARVYGIAQLPHSEFGVGHRDFFIMGLNWLASPPSRWAHTIAESALSHNAPDRGEDPSQRLVDWDRFREAVQAALKAFARGKDPSETSLAATRLVASRMEQGEGSAEAAAETLRDGVRQLAEDHARAHHAAVLRRTYINPAPKQLAAAESLGLTYGTYRRHLRQALRQLTEQLWQQELARR